jgi:phosphoenolpyruvate carboxykinase (ATP)
LEIDFMRIGLRNVSHKAEHCYTCRASLPKSPSPFAQSRVIFVPWEPSCIPTTQTRTTSQSAPYTLAAPRHSIASLSANDAVRMAAQRGIKETSDPVIRTASPAPLAQDFARQQVSRQQRSNFHSTSLNPILTNNMVTNTVNKTNLHPSGVA